MQPKWLDALWLKLSSVYPAWNSTVGLHPYVLDNGKPTTTLNSKGQAWSKGLAGLTGNEIKQGLSSLEYRDEKTFPPSVFEFKELCVGSEYEDTLDELLCRLQDGKEYEFANKKAFNLWCKYSFEYMSCHKYELPKLIKRHLSMFDSAELFELPDYNQKAIEKEIKIDNSKYNIKERSKFQSHICSCICKNNLIGYDKNKIKEIFTENGTKELIKKFKSKGYIMPENPITQAWMPSSSQELNNKSKKGKYKKAIAETFYNFCNEVGLLN